MPWSNRGGPTGGNGGGPWGQPGPRSPQPPNLEDLLRQGQDRFRRLLPTGTGGGRGLFLVALVVAAVWGASGFYRVEPDEQGVVLRFGEFVKTTLPGLHYHLPAPIEAVITPKVTTIHREEIGFRSAEPGRAAGRSLPEEALMLTGDENIIDVNFTVFWRVRDEVVVLVAVAVIELAAALAGVLCGGDGRLSRPHRAKRHECEWCTYAQGY